MTPRQVFALVLGGVLLITGIWTTANMFVHLDAAQLMVVQAPVSGTLTWYTQPGVYPQWFGKVTKYHKRSQFWYSNRPDQGTTGDQSIKIRFNDGGHAQISGSISWEMPIDPEHLTMLHTKYGSHDAIEQQLVRTVVEKSVYMTGPLMSSKESYAERRNDLLQFIEDQVQHGIYRTETDQVKMPDPITQQQKTVTIVKLVVDKNGQKERTDTSPLQDFGIRTYNPSINEIVYDKVVEEQIAQQQKAIMQVQTAQARAREAEQAALTAEKNGQAEAATAKWKQEVVKAQAVTEAQQELEVARLAAQTAEQYKRKQILEGEGDAEKRKLVMSADGALEKKLDALVKIQGAYAKAISDYQGNWVPQIVYGGSATDKMAGGGATTLIDLLTARTARDLAIDMQTSGAARTRRDQSEK